MKMKKLFLFIIIFVFSFMEAYSMENKQILTEKEKLIVEISSLTSKGNLENLSLVLNNALDKKMTINEINEILI